MKTPVLAPKKMNWRARVVTVRTFLISFFIFPILFQPSRTSSSSSSSPPWLCPPPSASPCPSSCPCQSIMHLLCANSPVVFNFFNLQTSPSAPRPARPLPVSQDDRQAHRSLGGPPPQAMPLRLQVHKGKCDMHVISPKRRCYCNCFFKT